MSEQILNENIFALLQIIVANDVMPFSIVNREPEVNYY